MTPPLVVQLSGGAGSWFAARLAIDARGSVEDVTLLFADTLIEDEDLHRFIAEAADDLGLPITRIADGRDPWQVFADVKFVGNTRVDPCSRILKRELLRAWLDDHHPEGCDVVVGIDFSEAHRTGPIEQGLLPHRALFPMLEHNFDKADAFAALAERQIELPRLNRLGFPHNNCGGFCVKAGQSQFALLLREFPERYAEHEQREHEMRVALGRDVAILRDRRGGKTRPMTMRAFRERVESGDYVDRGDWGGCGCALPGSQPSQLTLDLWEPPR